MDCISVQALRIPRLWSHIANINANLYLHYRKTISSTRILRYSTKEPPRDTFKIMILILCFLGALIVVSGSLLWRRRSGPIEVDETGNASRIQDLRTLKGQHETASILSELFDKDGAGAWPPKANHDSWPMALRPYKDIYLELIPLLPAAEPSLDDDVNNERRSKYRSLMRKLLAEQINIAQVKEVMAAVEAGNWHVLPRDAYNGFYACVAVSRHAYR